MIQSPRKTALGGTAPSSIPEAPRANLSGRGIFRASADLSPGLPEWIAYPKISKFQSKHSQGRRRFRRPADPAPPCSVRRSRPPRARAAARSGRAGCRKRRCPRPRLLLQNYRCDGPLAGVREAEVHPGGSLAQAESFRLPVQQKNRSPGSFPANFRVQPGHALGPAGAESLEQGLFRRETRREMRNRVPVASWPDPNAARARRSPGGYRVRASSRQGVGSRARTTHDRRTRALAPLSAPVPLGHSVAYPSARSFSFVASSTVAFCSAGCWREARSAVAAS